MKEILIRMEKNKYQARIRQKYIETWKNFLSKLSNQKQSLYMEEYHLENLLLDFQLKILENQKVEYQKTSDL